MDAKTEKWVRVEINAERRSAEDRAKDALKMASAFLRRRDYENAKKYAAEAVAEIAQAEVLDDLPGFLEERAMGGGLVSPKRRG